MSQAGVLNANQGSGGLFNLQKVIVQTGTSPVLVSPANAITFNGAVVAAGTNPVRTDGTAPFTMALEVQTAQAIASTNASNIGLAAFNSSQFTVDANGFVSLAGSGAVETFTVDASTAPGTNPVGPNGSGTVTITGGQVAAGTTTNVLRTNSLAANTYTIQVQRSQAVATTTIGDNGVSHFSSGQFAVDGNGFVTLVGGSGPPVLDFVLQTGTTPVTPASGAVTFNGSTVAAGTHPVRTDGTGANTMALEVQISQALAATDATKIGLSNFDSARFTVDANGFVSVNGSGVGETITGQSGGALSPTSGNWNISGGTVVAGTAPLVTSGAGSTLTINAQRSQAIASTDATKVGLAAFNSADFSVDANGFVSAAGAVALQFTASDATTATPSSGNINLFGAGSITTTATGSTVTTQLTGLTNHAVLVGAGTTTITKVGATANTGAVLQNNSGADPSYSTATYPSTTTVNQILYSSATNVVSGLATANNGVLTTGTSGTPVITALASDGQVIIGSSAGAPAAATLTAGTGIAITNGHNSISIATTGTTFLTITSVNHAASPYTVLTTDEFLACQTSTGTISLLLPNTTTTGRVFIIKDSNGAAATSNISVTTVGGTVTIDGQTTYKIISNYGSINVIFDGTAYEIY